MTVHFDPATLRQIAELATRRRVTRSAIIEAAVASFMSPDGPDRLEAALSRRLDRLTRQAERMERNIAIGNEAVALYVRLWLTNTAQLPEGQQAAANAKGRERYDRFIEALGRRLAKGRMLADEIVLDVDGSHANPPDP
jgi:predicted transcriptional regulator